MTKHDETAMNVFIRQPLSKSDTMGALAISSTLVNTSLHVTYIVVLTVVGAWRLLSVACNTSVAMDVKLALGVVVTLSVIEAFIPIAFGFASVQFGSLPSFPALLFLGGLVKLALLVLPASVDKSSGFLNEAPVNRRDSRAGWGKQGSSYQPPERPDSPLKGSKDQSSKDAQASGHVLLEFQKPDKQQQRHKAPKQQHPSPDSTIPQQHHPLSAGSSSKHWQLLLLSAVCSTIAANIMLSLIPELSPFAWSQLPLLQVLGLAVLAQFSSNRAGASGTSTIACWMLLLAIILGQGYFGSRPQSLVADQEAASILQGSNSMPARTQLQPLQVLAWAALAAALSTASGRLLLLARTASSSRHRLPPTQQHLCILQCVLYILCNLAWFLIKDGTLDTLLDDITPPHWHAVLLLGVSGLLRTTISCWPPQEELVAKGYAFQGAVVLAAWASSIFLDAPQTTQFAFSSFLAGLAVLILHHAQHPSTHQHGTEDSRDWQERMQGLLHSEVKARRINTRALRNMLSYVWLVVTFALMAVTGWAHLSGSGVLGHKYSFSHPASAHALEKAGISTARLMACSEAPLPLTQLYYSSSAAAASAAHPQPPGPLGASNHSFHSSSAGAAAGNRTVTRAPAAAGSERAAQPLVSVPAKLAGAFAASPGWDLCPALTCSRDPACTAANSTCCSHLLLSMAAFWDVFMHTHGLSSQYTLLYDSLLEALAKGALEPQTDKLHLGVSAQALAVLKRPCLKTELWQHGYALFLQGDSWRLCAHRQHPSATFTSHMHPVRHLTPMTSSGSLFIHVMWPLDGQSLANPAGNASASPQPAHQAASSAAANATGNSPTQQQQQQPFTLAHLKGWGRSSSSKRAAHTWMVCSTREVLTTGSVLTATLDGLRMPRPVGAGLSFGSGTAAGSSATVAQRYRATNRKADPACQKLIGELLARMET